MKYPSTEFDNAVAAVFHGTNTAEDTATLRELLRTNQDAQDEYLWRAELHGTLASGSLEFSRAAADSMNYDLQSVEVQAAPLSGDSSYAQWGFRSSSALVAVLAVVILGGGLWMWHDSQTGSVETGNPNDASVATIADLGDSRWMDLAVKLSAGDAVRVGQRIELSSGKVEVLFNTGARLSIVGPAIVEPLASNRVFLTFGEVNLLAETPESKGFTVVTPTSEFVDISTAFTARVSPDGLSRLNVTEGEVDVVLKGVEQAPRLRAGETLYVEPGERQIMTRIEEGDGTFAFRFPSIRPPSADDYADQARGVATIRVAQGKLKSQTGKSGPVTVLTDGKGQSHQDAPSESAFFADGTRGSFLIDLGQEVSISRVNSYSWHQHETNESHRHRARQEFTLYGYSGDQLPDLFLPPSESGWDRIARVNSDHFFEVSTPLDRPAQQACSIAAARGEIGRYRYLLWEVNGRTLFGEIDVYGSPLSDILKSKPREFN